MKIECPFKAFYEFIFTFALLSLTPVRLVGIVFSGEQDKALESTFLRCPGAVPAS